MADKSGGQQQYAQQQLTPGPPPGAQMAPPPLQPQGMYPPGAVAYAQQPAMYATMPPPVVAAPYPVVYPAQQPDHGASTALWVIVAIISVTVLAPVLFVFFCCCLQLCCKLTFESGRNP